MVSFWKHLFFYYLILMSIITSAQCVRKTESIYISGDPEVKIYPDNSNIFDKVDTIMGLLTWKLDPCIRYKVYRDQTKKSLASQYYFSGDTIIALYYYNNGKLRQVDKEVGKERLFIYTAAYYENGQILYSDNPNSIDARTIRHYYSDGKLKKEFVFWGASCWGVVKNWYPNGKTKSIEQFSELTEDAQQNYLTSIKEGVWQYWNEDGKLIKKIVYENDKIISEEDLNN